MSALWGLLGSFLVGVSIGAAIAGELVYRSLFKAWLVHVFDYHSEDIDSDATTIPGRVTDGN